MRVLGRQQFIDISEKNGKSILYVIRCFNDEENFYKVGVTTLSDNSRFYGIPYDIEIIIMYECKNSGFVYDLERKIKKLDKKYVPLIDFCGKSECKVSVENILDFLENISSWYTDFVIFNKQKNAAIGFSFKKLAMQYCQLMNDLDNCIDGNTRLSLKEEINTIISYSENLQKYHNILTPGNITSASYSKAKLDEMYDDIMLLKKINHNPLSLVNGSVYSVDDIKKKLNMLYVDLNVSRKSNTKDLKIWYDVKVSSMKISGSVVSALKITAIK